MINIGTIRDIHNPKIVMLGNHEGIIQSILDFDYLMGKDQPSITAIIGTQVRSFRYFFGAKQVLIHGYESFEDVDEELLKSVDLFAIAQSGRRVLAIGEQALTELPNIQGGMVFAEAVPERHALHLRALANKSNKFIIGPASVGMTIGGVFKLGAIGGTLPEQIMNSGILHEGSVAVVSTSGGMINELLSLVANRGGTISFAAAVGGERFPITTPVELVQEAINDPATDSILFFGELGGTDEYDIAQLLKSSRTSKPFIAYVAGVVAERFESAPQFGHAKALAQNASETASAKKQILRDSGALVADNFAELGKLIDQLPKNTTEPVNIESIRSRLESMTSRSDTLFHNGISTDKGGEVQILNQPLLAYVENRSLSEIALGMFLGHEPKSKKTIAFFDLCLRLLVDHGPQVSGAVNTMITARAGKDLSAALATGILTVGPRFGGALNQAAENWFEAVARGDDPNLYVEKFSSNKQYIPGIGHKKYRLDNPDPRVSALLKGFDNGGAHITFANEVASITTGKKAQLILNVDGAIAALLLDILVEEEGYNTEQIRSLIKTEFCNAIFIFARSVGFMAHFMEQKRLDEGLFRLPDDQISE